MNKLSLIIDENINHTNLRNIPTAITDMCIKPQP